MLKKLLAVIFIVSLFLFVSPKKILAAETGVKGIVDDVTDYCGSRSGNVVNLETWYSGKCFKLADALTGANPFNGQFRGFSDIVLLDLMTKVIGDDPALLKAVVGQKPSDSFIASGVLPSITNLIGQIAVNSPASSTNYLALVTENIQKHSNIVPPAYAASPGFGFTALTPVLKAWQGLRNIAYAVYILVFVMYGFMIMFRVKLDPKVVTGFQMAIPKLIVTLLLITFSYAIAGLLIDLTYLLSLAVGTGLESAGLIKFNQAPFSIPGITPPPLATVSDVLTGNGLGAFWLEVQIMVKMLLNDAIDQILALLVGLPAGLSQIITSWSISVIVKLVLIFALLYVFFKILMTFIQSYAKIILQIIFSPIILLGNVLPGNDAFGNWMRGLIAEMSVFPSTLIMLMMGATLMDTGSFALGGGQTPLNGSLWLPPGFSGESVSSGSGVSALLGYGIIFLAPKVADMVRDALKAPAFKYGGALGDPLKFGTKAPATAASIGEYITNKNFREAGTAAFGLFGITANLGPTIKPPPGAQGGK